MNIFNDYNYGRQLRRENKPVTDCENPEQVNGYWRQDQEKQPKRETNGLHVLIKPQSAGFIGLRAS